VTIQQNVSLKDHSTMRLGGTAHYLGIVQSRQDIIDAVAWAKANNMALIMIGSGSNIVGQNLGHQQTAALSLQMAVVVLTLVPLLIVYPFMQKHFRTGVLTGAIKG